MFARWDRMAKTFTRLGKEVVMAVKAGGADATGNPALRRVLQNCRAANMPKDKIENAIKRAQGGNAETYEELIYEGYAPHGIAVLVTTATDNPTRTAYQECVAALENGKYALAFSSGLAATDTLLHTLNAGDHVICSDDCYGGTFRLFDKVLTRFGLHRPLVSYHDHNETAAADFIAQKIAAGQSVALVSDAGTPAISDPGFRLVRACRRHGLPENPVPGACAVAAVLSASGLPTTGCLFAGF
jgi:hypothetical protein